MKETLKKVLSVAAIVLVAAVVILVVVNGMFF